MECSVCHHHNSSGSTHCQDCQSPLAVVPTGQATPQHGTTVPDPSIQPMPPDLIGTMAPSAGVSTGHDHLRGRLVVERFGRPVVEKVVDTEVISIGRADVDQQGMLYIPTIDLTEADTERIISRRHIQIAFSVAGAEITDLGSSNGTFLHNVGQLTPNQPYPFSPQARAMLGRGGFVVSWVLT